MSQNNQRYKMNNMKQGDSVQRHTNFQPMNPRPPGTYLQNPKAVHQTVHNPPPHPLGPHQGIHNIGPHHQGIPMNQINQMNNVQVTQQPFQQQRPMRPPNARNFPNRSNNQIPPYSYVHEQHPTMQPALINHPYPGIPTFYGHYPSIAIQSGFIPQQTQVLFAPNQPMQSQPNRTQLPNQPQPPTSIPSSIPNDVINNQVPIDNPIKTQLQPPQPTHPPQQKRERKAAIIIDPNTGQVEDLDELAQKPIENMTSNFDNHDKSQNPSVNKEDQQIKVDSVSVNVETRVNKTSEPIKQTIDSSGQNKEMINEPSQQRPPVIEQSTAIRNDVKPVNRPVEVKPVEEQSTTPDLTIVKQENVSPQSKRTSPSHVKQSGNQQQRPNKLPNGGYWLNDSRVNNQPNSPINWRETSETSRNYQSSNNVSIISNEQHLADKSMLMRLNDSTNNPSNGGNSNQFQTMNRKGKNRQYTSSRRNSDSRRGDSRRNSESSQHNFHKDFNNSGYYKNKRRDYDQVNTNATIINPSADPQLHQQQQRQQFVPNDTQFNESSKHETSSVFIPSSTSPNRLNNTSFAPNFSYSAAVKNNAPKVKNNVNSDLEVSANESNKSSDLNKSSDRSKSSQSEFGVDSESPKATQQNVQDDNVKISKEIKDESIVGDKLVNNNESLKVIDQVSLINEPFDKLNVNGQSTRVLSKSSKVVNNVNINVPSSSNVNELSKFRNEKSKGNQRSSGKNNNTKSNEQKSDCHYKILQNPERVQQQQQRQKGLSNNLKDSNISNDSIEIKNGSSDSSKENSFNASNIKQSDIRGLNEKTTAQPPETQMSNLENKVENLKLTDSTVQVKDEPAQVHKSTDKPIVDDKNVIIVESKDIQSVVETTLSPQPPIKHSQPEPTAVQQPAQPATQHAKQQTTQVTQQQQQKQSKSIEQPKQAPVPKKKSSLEGCQSKSDSKNISYDAEFLKSLQFSDLSVQKPNFTQRPVEILLQEARSFKDQSNDTFDFSRSSMGPRMGDKPRKIIASGSLTQDVKLRTTENAWKPDRNKKMDDESAEALLKKARGLLNKLTPQNFEKISDQFLSLDIGTPEKLQKMIELIFDKAVDEPNFCEQYAMLCRNMSNITVTPQTDGKPFKFNRMLLEKCQNCFETDKYKDIDLESRQKVIDQCNDKEKKQLLIDELDEEKRLIRKKSLGNIKLIGALYKNGKLKDEIMDLCINTLLENADEDSYECLCSLLKSIGEKFEKSLSSKSKFNSQMKQLEQVVKQNKIASRIKFLIMDVLDMRKEGWKPRKLQDVNKPKTIEEVHEDAKKQEEQSNREISQLGKRNDQPKKRNDNWMNSNSRKSQQSGTDAISNLRKLNEMRTENTPFGFTPKTFGSWSQGASGNKSSASNSNDKRQVGNQTPTRNDSRINDSRSSSRKTPFNGTYTGGNESEDFKLMEKYSGLIVEYVKFYESESLINSIYDLSTEECVYLFVVSAIESACENCLKHISKIGELLADLVIKNKIISYQQFNKGLKHHLDTSQDVLTDVPRFFEYIGQILSYFFFKLPDDYRRTFFKEALQPCLQFDTSIKILAHLIKHSISSCAGETEVVNKWLSAKMSLKDFSEKQSEDQIKEVLRKDYNLDKFLTELSSSKSINDKSVELSNLCNRILKDKFDEIPKLLEQSISSGDADTKKKLISALIERCVKESTVSKGDNYSFVKENFESKINKVKRELFDDVEIQIEMICSACKVNEGYNNPKDFILNVISFMYEGIKIIVREALLKWYNKKDDSVHTIARMQLKRFIENLQKSND